MKKWNWTAFGFLTLLAVLTLRTMQRTHHVGDFFIVYTTTILPLTLFVAWITREKN